MAQYQRTPIDNLMDLDSHDPYSRGPSVTMPNVGKYIRGDSKTQFQTGMNGGHPMISETRMMEPPPDFRTPNFGSEESGEMVPHSYNSQLGPALYTKPNTVNQINPFDGQIIERLETITQPTVLNCPEVFSHIRNCPICSKFYNTDKTVYIIAIVLLSLVCIILLKRVLEK